jgi:dTDP-4-amino-4,6-dideoxygalactose transaminase
MENFKYFNVLKKNKISKIISETSLSLPSGYDLENKEIDKICILIKNFVN